MLQQTQAARVVPKWTAFLESFPTPSDCASASLGDVLRLWQGLGYPRRARDLRAAAAEVDRLGAFPDTLAGLLALPGVGQYTARAVLAFAFEADAAVVDTNIARVYARVAGRSLRPKEVQRLADEALPIGDSWAWNQVLMDLGAVLCRPTRPACTECPVRGSCAWTMAGRPDPDPAIGSAGVSGRQAPFAGSDREARGRLIRMLGQGPVRVSAAAEIMGRSTAEAERLTAALIAEGLVTLDHASGVLALPDT